jgi:hypothetical protein
VFRRLYKQYWRVALGAVVALGLAGCSSAPEPSELRNLFAPSKDMFAAPDWGVFRGSKAGSSSVVTPEDLVSADGTCAARPSAPAPATSENQGATEAPHSASLDAKGPSSDIPPALAGGIGLGMTECDVAQRAGAPEQVNLGTDDKGERSVVLTYTSGPHAGIYRFRAGRLMSIERVAVAEPEKPKKVAKPAHPKAAPKIATTRTASAPKKTAAAPAPADDPNIWPAPPPPPKP